jgi:hypothetical protein
MFKQVLDKVSKEASGEIALNYVAEISSHHRIQASPGLSDAVSWAVDTFKANGLEAEVHSYPADGKGYAWSSLMFKEWNCRDAELELIEPIDKACFLARWKESKLSLVQRSHPAGPVTAEMVHVGKGEEPEDYKGLDVRSKIVLADGDVQRVHRLAVEERGALGLIYYGTWIREPDTPEGELDDALKYTSFWWAGDEKPGFGFVLTPRRGRWLRDLIRDSKEPVRVNARVDSSIYEGMLDNAYAIIRGTTGEQVVVVAHICHPQPSCNDNASGSAAAMESARLLQKLIKSGELPRPSRSIVFTLVPEMSGSYAHLAAREAEIPDMVAAVNLDMVGEKQCVTSSSFIVERTPEALPSYVNSLIECIFKEVARDVKNLGGSSSYALFRHTTTPFSGGSDHYVYSDPTVGVPCPMLIQWPDKFWHTSYDTMDKVDPAMLKRAAVVTATYAYFLASAGPAEATWVASETHSREKKLLLERFRGYVEKATSDPSEAQKYTRELKDQAAYWTDVAVRAVDSVKRLAPNNEVLENAVAGFVRDLEAESKAQVRTAVQTINTVLELSRSKTKPYRKPQMRKLEKEADALVPTRLFRGPWSTRGWDTKLSQAEQDELRRLDKKHPEGRGAATVAMYWTDGHRSLYDVSELVRMERGSTDLEYLVKLYRLLELMGLMKLGHR